MHLTVLVGGDDPDLITTALGLQPTATWVRGSRPHVRSPFSGWVLSSEESLPRSAATSEHLRWLLARLLPVTEQLDRVRGMSVDMRVWVVWSTDNAGPHVRFDPDVLRDLGSLGLSLHIDAYRHLNVPTAELDRLRRLAWDATPGPWQSWVEGRDGTGGDSVVISEADGAPDLYPRVVLASEYNENWIADQDFIAAANPAVVLSLIDLASERHSLVAELELDRPVLDELAGAARALLDLAINHGWHEDAQVGSVGQTVMDLTDPDAGRRWWESNADHLPESPYPGDA